ncbi:MAG: AzlC family ABC transporter permease [Oscillospiraceae bacterium]|nr:AzlC family ABC transporter permease [Oscillospiraceae bacterium]
MYAAPKTVPVLIGFIVLGIAYGILMSAHGIAVKWSVAMSLIAYCGSMQYVAIGLFLAAFDPLYAFFMSVMVNARHLFYGISMLEKYRGMGWLKPLLIYVMTDETFSIQCGQKVPDDIDRKVFYATVAFLNYFYWFVGTLIGAVAGQLITFNTTGMDFVLTAMFVVTFTEQWITQYNHKPAVIGVLCSVASLIIFGSGSFMIVGAMALILLVMTIFRKSVDEEAEL